MFSGWQKTHHIMLTCDIIITIFGSLFYSLVAYPSLHPYTQMFFNRMGCRRKQESILKYFCVGEQRNNVQLKLSPSGIVFRNYLNLFFYSPKKFSSFLVQFKFFVCGFKLLFFVFCGFLILEQIA